MSLWYVAISPIFFLVGWRKIEIAETNFRGPHYPVTAIAFHNTIEIKFSTSETYIKYSAVIEYDVVHKSNPQNHLQWDKMLFIPRGVTT